MRLIALTVLAGVLVGTTGQFTDEGPRVLQWANAIAAAWIISAFAVGALAGSGLRAALAGAGTMVVGVVSYYALYHAHSAKLMVVVAAWSAVGVAIGAVIGWAGDAWRRKHAQAIGVALLSGALAGEAILLFGEWHNRTSAHVVLASELVLGAALPYLLARPRLARTVALTAVVAVAVMVAEASVRDAMYAVGWRGR